MTNATKRPWKVTKVVDGTCLIGTPHHRRGRVYQLVAEVYPAENKLRTKEGNAEAAANARLILQAVNTYAAREALLREALTFVYSTANHLNESGCASDAEDHFAERIEKALKVKP